MNQRRDARFATDQRVWITLYGKVDTRVQGHIRNISGRGIGLEVDLPIHTGTALKIELEDSLLLGEVIYCRQEKGGFYVGAELEQALHGLVELGEMLRRFTTERLEAEPDCVVSGNRDREERQRR